MLPIEPSHYPDYTSYSGNYNYFVEKESAEQPSIVVFVEQSLMAVVEHGRGVSGRLLQTFLAGLMGILPVALTLATFAWVVVFIHNLAGPKSAFGGILRSLGMTLSACEFTAYAIGLVVTALLVYGLGWVFEGGMGRRLHGVIDDALERVPVVSTVYDASKNITSVFSAKKDSLQSMAPVMCYFGGDLGVGTPALMPTAQLVRLGGHSYHVVIIPTAPVPFGGALLCVRAEWVRPVACSFDELLGIYISMGVSAPEYLRDVAAAHSERTSTSVSTPVRDPSLHNEG